MDIPRSPLAERLDQLGHAAREARNSWISIREKDIVSPIRIITWTLHLAALLAGVRDEKCILNKLHGREASVLSEIYAYAFGFIWDNYFGIRLGQGHLRFVDRTLPAVFHSDRQRFTGDVYVQLRMYCDEHIHAVNDVLEPTRTDKCAFSRCGNISFPLPSGVNVNMLPFIMGDKTSLPDELQKYYDPLIGQCPVNLGEMDKVCYLSITKRNVAKESLHRVGLHIEAPLHFARHRAGCASFYLGPTPDEFHGGIFMAYNVGKSCAIYDALIEREAADSYGGGIAHLHPLLRAPYFIPANELIWMTDRTPHQSLRHPKAGYCQFFRLVTSSLKVWHEKDYTANPKVPVPDDVQFGKAALMETMKRTGTPTTRSELLLLL